MEGNRLAPTRLRWSFSRRRSSKIKDHRIACGMGGRPSHMCSGARLPARRRYVFADSRPRASDGAFAGTTACVILAAIYIERWRSTAASWDWTVELVAERGPAVGFADWWAATHHQGFRAGKLYQGPFGDQLIPESTWPAGPLGSGWRTISFSNVKEFPKTLADATGFGENRRKDPQQRKTAAQLAGPQCPLFGTIHAGG